MWKFDLRSADPANWKVAYGSATKRPLFTAVDASGNRQPITVRPEVTRGPKGAGMVVLFGTGKYLEPADLLSLPERPQSFYGIIDRNTGTGSIDRVARADLTQQTIDNELTYDPPDPDGPTKPLGDPPPIKARITSEIPVGDSGWYMDLVSPVEGYKNEKQVSTPIVRNGNVIFTTVIPETNPCSGGGRSWIMELSVLSGSTARRGAVRYQRRRQVRRRRPDPGHGCQRRYGLHSAQRARFRRWHGHSAVAGRGRWRTPVRTGAVQVLAGLLGQHSAHHRESRRRHDRPPILATDPLRTTHMIRKQRGVTLMELMTVVAIISILASIAYPSYRAQVRRSNRTEARVALEQTAGALEKCYTRYMAYDDAANCPAANQFDWGAASTHPRASYRISAPTPDATRVHADAPRHWAGS